MRVRIGVRLPGKFAKRRAISAKAWGTLVLSPFSNHFQMVAIFTIFKE
jgi:hypothetical protein